MNNDNANVSVDGLLYAVIGILVCLVVLFGGYFVYKEYVEPNESNNTNETTEDTKDATKETNEEEKITCSDCVDRIVLPTVYAEQKSQEVKILLGNKIRTLKLDITESKNGPTIMTVSVDGKVLKKESSLSSISAVYVIANDVIMVDVTGSDVRNEEYYFYSSDLKEISVDMTLDSKYPKSMVQGLSSDIEVVGNKIIITGTRLTHGFSVVSETGESEELCISSGNPSTALNNHVGELIDAQYEMEYLGNNKFSSFKKVKDIRTIDKTLCNYE